LEIAIHRTEDSEKKNKENQKETPFEANAWAKPLGFSLDSFCFPFSEQEGIFCEL